MKKRSTTVSNFSLGYNVDIAMVIDATGSMRNLLDTVKSNAMNFHKDLTDYIEKRGRHIDTLRVRIFAPEKKYWSTIYDTWDNVLHFPSQAGQGLESLEYEDILSAILSIDL